MQRSRVETAGAVAIGARRCVASRRAPLTVASRIGLGLAFLGLTLLAPACGGEDVTTLTPENAIEELSPEPAGDSRVFTVLSRPESVDAVCRLIGVSAPPDAAGGCADVVNSCRDGLGAALGDRAAPELPNRDLEPLFGCPLTVVQLDGCIAGVLERGVAAYGESVGCDMPAPPAVDTLALFASPDCLAVALFCPDLVASLAGGL